MRDRGYIERLSHLPSPWNSRGLGRAFDPIPKQCANWFSINLIAFGPVLIHPLRARTWPCCCKNTKVLHSLQIEELTGPPLHCWQTLCMLMGLISLFYTPTRTPNHSVSSELADKSTHEKNKLPQLLKFPLWFTSIMTHQTKKSGIDTHLKFLCSVTFQYFALKLARKPQPNQTTCWGGGGRYVEFKSETWGFTKQVFSNNFNIPFLISVWKQVLNTIWNKRNKLLGFEEGAEMLFQHPPWFFFEVWRVRC